MHSGFRDVSHRVLDGKVILEMVLVPLEMLNLLEFLATRKYWNTKGLKGPHRSISQTIPLCSTIGVWEGFVAVDLPCLTIASARKNSISKVRHGSREPYNPLELATQNLIVVILPLRAMSFA
jgi:hypothetical protein